MAHPHFADRFADFMWQIIKMLNDCSVQSWVNIHRKGQGINWHNHPSAVWAKVLVLIYLLTDPFNWNYLQAI